MSIHPLAGKPVEPSMLVNIPRLVTAYYTERPDPAVPAQRVAFGTSGHRGSAFAGAFSEAHILAMTQAICAYRQQHHIDGPLFLGMDTHALSEPAFATALEVLAAYGVDVMIDRHGGYTPTPVISYAILTYNRGRTREFGEPVYERLDAPATPEQKAVLQRLSPQQIDAAGLAGKPVVAMLTEAPGNGSAIGGIKVITANGWFAARPSGTENVYKIYAESFRGPDHLRQIQEAAEALIAKESAARI